MTWSKPPSTACWHPSSSALGCWTGCSPNSTYSCSSRRSSPSGAAAGMANYAAANAGLDTLAAGPAPARATRARASSGGPGPTSGLPSTTRRSEDTRRSRARRASTPSRASRPAGLLRGSCSMPPSPPWPCCPSIGPVPPRPAGAAPRAVRGAARPARSTPCTPLGDDIADRLRSAAPAERRALARTGHPRDRRRRAPAAAPAQLDDSPTRSASLGLDSLMALEAAQSPGDGARPGLPAQLAVELPDRRRPDCRTSRAARHLVRGAGTTGGGEHLARGDRDLVGSSTISRAVATTRPPGCSGGFGDSRTDSTSPPDHWPTPPPSSWP